MTRLQITSRAQYFDSHSPLPFEGELRIFKDSLQFQCSTFDPIIFLPDDIVDIRQVSETLHIELRYPGETSRSRLIITENQDSLGELQKLMNAYRASSKISNIPDLHRIPLAAKILLFLVVIPPLMFFGLRSLELLHHAVPSSVDKALGAKVSAHIEKSYEVCRDDELDGFMQQLLLRLKASSAKNSYQVKILKNQMVNAFALPDGSIYFFSGLLEQSSSPEEIAGILAHEIAHVELRHGIKAMIKATGTAVLFSLIIGSGLDGVGFAETASEIASSLVYLSYSRDSEKEADYFAAKSLIAGKISLQGFIDFFSREQESFDTAEQSEPDSASEAEPVLNFESALEWLSTHPLSPERLKYIRAEFEVQSRDNPPQEIAIADWNAIKVRCKLTE